MVTMVSKHSTAILISFNSKIQVHIILGKAPFMPSGAFSLFSQPAMYYNRKIALTTLGCKLNFSETSAIGRTLTDNGYQKVDWAERADYYIINTALSQRMPTNRPVRWSNRPAHQP